MKQPLFALFLFASCGSDASKPTEAPKQVLPGQALPTQSPSSGPTPPKPIKPVKKSVTIAAVGDVLPHGPLKESAAKHNLVGSDGVSTNHAGYDTLFDRAKVGFTDADISFANLESPIAPKNDHGSRPFVFNAPVDLLGGLTFFGADVLSAANNHAYDQGRAAFSETQDNLDAAGFISVGVGRNQAEAYTAKVIEKNGLKICFLGQARLLNGNLQPKSDKDPQLFFVPYGKEGVDAKKKAIEAIKEAKKGCDFLLMSIHWGVEYELVPHGDDQVWAKAQLDAGVDGILGHHPHVLQPLEEYTTKDGRKTFVAFSMGNFVSNQTKAHNKGNGKIAHTRDSMILRVTIAPRADGLEGPQGVLEKVGYYPAWTDRQTRPDEKSLGMPIIRGVVVDQEIKDAEQALATLKAKSTLTTEEQSDKKQWQERLNLFNTRRKELSKIVGEKYVLPLP